MADFAELTVVVDSRGVAHTRGELGRFAKGAGKAEKATSALTGSLVRLVTAFGGIMIVRSAVKSTVALQTALAEVASISGDVRDNLDSVRASIQDMSVEIGTSAVIAAKGLYQAISAGITDTEDALLLTATAARAAIAGLTNTAVAVDVISSAMNAYGMSGQAAGAISDVLFTAVREGKTTFDELAGSMGRAMAISAQAGVSLRDLTAAVTTLTKGGIATDEAVTSIRAILVQLIKPGESAQKVARQLGIDFSAAALKAKGLGGVLDDVRKATSGNVKLISELFPNVRALGGALALTGSQAGEFNRQLQIMQETSGATEKAFGVMADTMSVKMAKLSAMWQRLVTGIEPALSVIVDLLSSFFANIDTWMTTAISSWSRGWVKMKFVALTIWEALKFAWEVTVTDIENTWKLAIALMQRGAADMFRTAAEGMLKLEQGIAAVGGSVKATWTGPLLKASMTLAHAAKKNEKSLVTVVSLTERLGALEKARAEELRILANAEDRRFAELDGKYKGLAATITSTSRTSGDATKQTTADIEAQADAADAFIEEARAAEAATAAAAAATARTLGGEMRQLSLTFGTSIIDALFDAEQRAALTFEKIASSFAKMVARMMAQQALLAAVGLPSMFGPGRVASAKGNVFSHGNIVPMARGGIVTEPTLFPMQRGAGLMGEAGPEAVMPLTRTSSGELGVKAEGAGAEVNVNIINNTGARVTQRRRQSGRGVEVDVMIGESVDRQVKDGRFDRSMRSAFGLTRRGGR